jgi:hypothetical protein
VTLRLLLLAPLLLALPQLSQPLLLLVLPRRMAHAVLLVPISLASASLVSTVSSVSAVRSTAGVETLPTTARPAARPASESAVPSTALLPLPLPLFQFPPALQVLSLTLLALLPLMDPAAPTV